MRKLVLDTSVPLAWLFPDESSPYADSVMEALRRDQAVAPPVWKLELLNALLCAERRGRVSRSDIGTFISAVRNLSIETDVDSGTGWEDLLRLAHDQSLSVYDATYVDLALRRGLALATLDERMKAAAERVGVTLYQP